MFLVGTPALARQGRHSDSAGNPPRAPGHARQHPHSGPSRKPSGQGGVFVDRRAPSGAGPSPGRERRQFTNSHEELSPEAADLARAIDAYKLRNRRRFINYEEMLGVIKGLGYHL